MEHLRLRYPIYMKGSKGQSLGWMPGLGREGKKDILSDIPGGDIFTRAGGAKQIKSSPVCGIYPPLAALCKSAI